MSRKTQQLRDDLMDYYGTAVFAGMAPAAVDLFEVENADDRELIAMAEELGWDLTEYGLTSEDAEDNEDEWPL